MKIGSEEWFEELKNVGRFPGMYCFSLGFDKERTKYVTVQMIQTKSKNPDNVKYSSLSPTLLQSLQYKDILILGVHYVETPEEYYDILSDYMKKWTNDDNKKATA